MVLESPLDFRVVLSEVHDTLLLALLLVVSFDVLELLPNFFFQVFQESGFNFSNSFFLEVSERSFFSCLVNFSQLVIIEGPSVLELVGNSFDEHIV